MASMQAKDDGYVVYGGSTGAGWGGQCFAPVINGRKQWEASKKEITAAAAEKRQQPNVGNGNCFFHALLHGLCEYPLQDTKPKTPLVASCRGRLLAGVIKLMASLTGLPQCITLEELQKAVADLA
ncbi:unnamed protein product, partial [Chrysoparadoxa australica]